MIVRAHDSSLAVVTALAHEFSRPSAVAFKVARAASSSAAARYPLASRLETDWLSASLPKPLPRVSLGNQSLGGVVSRSRSRTVLLNSNVVSRRSGARPGAAVGHDTVPPAPVTLAPPAPVTLVPPVPVTLAPPTPLPAFPGPTSEPPVPETTPLPPVPGPTPAPPLPGSPVGEVPTWPVQPEPAKPKPTQPKAIQPRKASAPKTAYRVGGTEPWRRDE